MPHFCLKVREIAKNGTKAHLPKTAFSAEKRPPKFPLSTPATNPDPKTSIPQHHPTSRIHHRIASKTIKKAKSRAEAHHFRPFPTICARFGLILQEWAENCSKLHEVAKICTKLKENAQTCKKRRPPHKNIPRTIGSKIAASDIAKMIPKLI